MSGKMTSFWLRTAETALLVMAFMLPLAFFLRTFDGTAIKTTLFELGTLVLAFAWLFKGLERGRWELPQASRAPAAPALALLAWLITRFLMNPYKLAALPGLLPGALGVVAFLICLLELGGTQNARRLFGWIAAAAWLAGLYGLAQRLGFDPLAWKGAFGASVFSTLGGPEAFGAFLTVCAPLALTLWLDPERDPILRWLDAALLALLTLDAVWTRAPGQVLAYALTCALTAAALPLFFPSKASYQAAGLAVCAAATSALALFFGPMPAIGALKISLEDPAGFALFLWLGAALAFTAWRARRQFLRNGAMNESCYLGGLAAASAGAVLAGQAGAPSGLLPAALAWPLAGMLAGLAALGRRGAFVSVLPLPLRQNARRAFYAPIMAGFAALAFFPARWLDSEVQQNAALFDLKQGRLVEAVARLDRVAPGAESYIEAQYLKGEAQLGLDKPQEALATYSHLETLAPDYRRLNYQMASAYAAVEDWTSAAKRHARQAELTPEDAANFAGWAQAAKRAGDLVSAENAALAAMRLEPENPAHRLALAEIYLKERRLNESRQQQSEAAKLQKERKKKPRG